MSAQQGRRQDRPARQRRILVISQRLRRNEGGEGRDDWGTPPQGEAPTCGKKRHRQVEPHGFTAVVPLVTSAEPAEACPPSLHQSFGGHPLAFLHGLTTVASCVGG